MGSKLGWIIGGVFAAVIIIFILLTLVFPSPSKPTRATTEEGALELHVIDFWPQSVVGGKPTGSGNAGDDYVEAIDMLQSNMDVIKNALSGGYENVPPDSPAVDALEKIESTVADGNNKAEMQYTLVHTPKDFRVSHTFRPALNLEEVAGAMNTLAQIHMGNKKYDEAIEALKRMFILGWHMTSERSRGDMVLKGISLRKRAAKNLLAAYEKKSGSHKEQKNDLKKFIEEAEYIEAVQGSKQRILRKWPAEPGDIFNIAENDKDRAWRVEAILHLGYMKFRRADERGDMRKLNNLIEHYMENGDKLEKAAARAARDFTRQQYRKSDSAY